MCQSSGARDPSVLYRQRLKNLASDLHTLHSQLVDRMDTLTEEHKRLYLHQSLGLLRPGGGPPRPVNLHQLLFQLSSLAKLVSDTPASSVADPQLSANVYMLLANAAGPAMHAVNRSSYLFHEQAKAAVENAGVVTLVTFLVAVAVLAGTFFFAYVPLMREIGSNTGMKDPQNHAVLTLAPDATIQIFLTLPDELSTNFEARATQALQRVESMKHRLV